MEIKQDIDERIGTLIASIVGIAGVPSGGPAGDRPGGGQRDAAAVAQIRQNLDDMRRRRGDLTRRLPVTSYDELGELAGSSNRFVEKIHGLVRQIAGMTGDLKQLVEQMSAQAERSGAGHGRQRHETDRVATAINGCPPPPMKWRRAPSAPPRSRAADRPRRPGGQARGGRQHRAHPRAGGRDPRQRDFWIARSRTCNPSSVCSG